MDKQSRFKMSVGRVVIKDDSDNLDLVLIIDIVSLKRGLRL